MVEQNGKSLTSTTKQSIPQPGVVSQQQNQTRTPIYTDREILQLANNSMGGTDITALEQGTANQAAKVNALKADPAKASEYLTEKAKLDDLNKKYHRASTLDFFSAKMQYLEAAENALDEQQTKLDEAIASGEDDEVIKAHKNRLTVLKGKVTRAEAAIKNVENTHVMKDLLKEARVKAESGRPIRGTIAEARQGVEKRKKVLRDMLMKNSKDQHIPEALRKTVGDLLESINFDSKRSMHGGQQTKKDIKYTDAYNSRIPPPPFR